MKKILTSNSWFTFCVGIFAISTMACDVLGQGGAIPDRNQLFTQKDADQDGKMSRTEFMAGAPETEEKSKRFTEWDLDHDGFLSLNEFVSMGKGAKPAPAPAASSKPAEPPKPGSGAKPVAESFVATTPKQMERLVMFDKRDSNGDGKLTLEEFLSGQPDPGDTAYARFKYYDVDKDGFLSREEYVKELVKGE